MSLIPSRQHKMELSWSKTKKANVNRSLMLHHLQRLEDSKICKCIVHRLITFTHISSNEATFLKMYPNEVVWCLNHHYMSRIKSTNRPDWGSSKPSLAPVYEWHWWGQPSISKSTWSNLFKSSSLIRATSWKRWPKQLWMVKGGNCSQYRTNSLYKWCLVTYLSTNLVSTWMYYVQN